MNKQDAKSTQRDFHIHGFLKKTKGLSHTGWPEKLDPILHGGCGGALALIIVVFI